MIQRVGWKVLGPHFLFSRVCSPALGGRCCIVALSDGAARDWNALQMHRALDGADILSEEAPGDEADIRRDNVCGQSLVCGERSIGY